MATTLTSHHKFSSLTKTHKTYHSSPLLLLSTKLLTKSNPSKNTILSAKKTRTLTTGSLKEDKKVVPVKDKPLNDKNNPLFVNGSKDSDLLPSSSPSNVESDDDEDRMTSRAINATIVLGCGTLAVSRLLTIDYDYWHVSNAFVTLNSVPFASG